MFFKEDTTFNDIRDKSLQQWLDEMEQHQDVAVRGGVKLTREYVQYLKDVIAGIFDESMLNYRQCSGTELCRVPLCCAVSVNHRLAKKKRLTIQDLYGENLLLMHRGWSHYIDLLRDDLWTNHYNIHIVDFDFYSLEIFNRCENSNDILIAIENWKTVHPLLKILPVDWNYTIPFGILHAPEPSKTVQRFLQAIPAVMEL